MVSYRRSMHRTIACVRYEMGRHAALLKFVFFTSLAFGLWKFFSFSAALAIVTSFTGYLVTGGWRFTRICMRTIKRDARGLWALVKTKQNIKYYSRRNYTIPILFELVARRQLGRPAFVMDGQSWSFIQVDEYANTVANFLHEAGFQHNDVIAIFMENRPEFVCLWLGMAKIGVVASLINYNLRNEALVHCLQVCHAKAVIYSAEMSKAMQEARGQLDGAVSYYCVCGEDSTLPSKHQMDARLRDVSRLPPPVTHVRRFTDKLFYIYTSGTTGLPKAAVISHSRFYYIAYALSACFHISPSDVVYNVLPLYHTAGGILGAGQAILAGSTVVLKKKFSASAFWDDVVKYDCTVIQYIGEICRYLLAQPVRPSEKQHRVRVACGNGLRPQIWTQFTSRFNIPQVGEFYGATEGNANIVNNDSTVGAVGFTTRIAPFLYPVRLIKVDEMSGEPLRDRKGLCILCEPGEPGELIGKIKVGDPIRGFEGYSSKSSTQKKIVNNVFKKGDAAFLSGDILEMDEDGYMYFKDRTGDTFRWRGENVSTSEVEGAIQKILHMKDCVVYGVDVPGCEGKAGMAAIVDDQKTVDLQLLARDMNKALPAYARPLFIRLLDTIETTGTHKLKKVDLRKEGIDPRHIKDRLYYMDGRSGQYLPLDNAAYSAILNGKIRL